MPLSLRTPGHRPRLLRPFCLLGLVALMACSAAPMHKASPLTATDTDWTLLEAAGDGDVFALEAALPRIGDPRLAALARARIAAAQLREDRAEAALAPLLADAGASPRIRAQAWAIAAGARLAAGDYARAAAAAAAWQAALDQAGGDAQQIRDAAQLHGIAAQLAPLPAQSLDAFAPRAVAVRRDKAGLPRATITVNGIDQDAVLDTGANLSVASASAARALGLRLLDGEASVGSGSRDAVAVRLAVADTLEFAGASLSNVVFLVLEDAQLQMPVPGGYHIDAILGFPAMRALGRIRFEADGRLMPEAVAIADTDTAVAGNLRAVGSNLYVDTQVGGRRAALHLDSGAPRTGLSARFAERHPQLLQGLQRREQRMAGAGGATTRQVAVWPQVAVRVDGRTATLPEIEIVTADSAEVTIGNAGTLGGDVLGAFQAWTLDLVRMQLELDAPRARPDATQGGS